MKSDLFKLLNNKYQTINLSTINYEILIIWIFFIINKYVISPIDSHFLNDIISKPDKLIRAKQTIVMKIMQFKSIGLTYIDTIPDEIRLLFIKSII